LRLSLSCEAFDAEGFMLGRMFWSCQLCTVLSSWALQA
jgi:hypothetical protein